MDGSSPLARGTADSGCWQFARFRFIPAGAGNRASPVGLPSFTPVHPRWRGEQVQPLEHASFTAAVHPRWRGEQLVGAAARRLHCGSSPLARGTAAPLFEYLDATRFIPAGAGNRGGGG